MGSRALGVALALGSLLGLYAHASATDVKGSVRGGEPVQAATDAVRGPYWQEWNGFVEPKKDGVDYAREVSVVLVGPEGQRDATVVKLSGGTLTPSTIVAQQGKPLRIRNEDDFSHELRADKVKQFDAVETSAGQTREVQMLETGDFEITDGFAPHVHGYLHVLPTVTAVANPRADGTFVFEGVRPGSYTLKVFRGPYEISSSALEVKDTREISIDPISLQSKAKK